MAKEAFDSIMAGLEDALAYAEGDRSRGVLHKVEVPAVDVQNRHDEVDWGEPAGKEAW